MRKALFVFLLLCFSAARAQGVFISQDFQNCGIGVKDSSNNWVIQPIYTNIDQLGLNYFRVYLGEKCGVVSDRGQHIIPPIYDNIYLQRAGELFYFDVKLDGKHGLRDTLNKEILPLAYEQINVYPDGSIGAKKGWHKVYLYDRQMHAVKLSFSCVAVPEFVADSVYLFKKRFLGLHYGHSFASEYFRRGKYGLVDPQGKFLLQPKYASVKYTESNPPLIRTERKNAIEYRTVDGKLIWHFDAEDYIGMDELYLSNWTPLTLKGMAAASIKHHWGIAGIHGDTILPFIYNSVEENVLREVFPREFYTQTVYRVETTDHLYGYFNPKTKSWLVKPEYEKLFVVNNYSTEQDSDFVVVVLAEKNGKTGVFTSAGQEILPFIFKNYDAVPDGGYIFSNDTCAVRLSFVMANRLSERNAWTRQQHYITEYAVHTIPRGGLMQRVEKNGNTLFINPGLVHDPQQLKLYNTGNMAPNKNTYDSLLHATAVMISPFRKIKNLSDGALLAYNMPADLYLWSEEPDTTTYRIDPDLSHWRPVQEYKIISDATSSYFIPEEDRGGRIYRGDGTLLRGYLEYAYSTGGSTWFIVAAQKGKRGIIDGNGKLIADTIYENILSMNDDVAVVVVTVKKKNSTKHEKGYEYNLLDFTTGKMLLPEKHKSISYILLDKDVAITEDETGRRLFNTKQKKYVTAGFNDFLRLDSTGTYFAAKTCTGHMGLVDHNGNWISDTSWYALSLARYHKSPSENYHVYGDFDYVVFFNDTAYMLFDLASGKITNDKATRLHIMDEAAHNYKVDSSGRWTPPFYDSPGYAGADDRPVSIPEWQQLVLFDSLFTMKRFEPDSNNSHPRNNCDYCAKNFGKKQFFYLWSRKSYYSDGTTRSNILYTTPSAFSAEITNEKIYYFNTMLFADGPHAMLLDSLFTGTAWKQVISREILNFLDTARHVNGNCSNPNMFPVMCQSRFSFSKTGLFLYPPGYFQFQRINNYRSWDTQVKVFIPWEMLKPYMRQEVIDKLQI